MHKRKNHESSAIVARMKARDEEIFRREHGMREVDRQLDDVFERLYFHELDGRDKVVQRLQLPLVAFIALLGLLGHIVQSAQRTFSGSTAWLWLLVGCSCALLLAAAFFFVMSVVGHTYSFLPVPSEWQDYKDKCIALYHAEIDVDKLVSTAIKKGLMIRYAECATINGHINAKKSFYVFMILRFLIAGAIMAVAAYALFFFGELGSKPTYRVELTNVANINRTDMTSHKPPPPPPPPPSRQVRDDRSPPRPPVPRPPAP